MASLIEAIAIKRKMFFEFENAPYHCLDVEVSKPTARGGQTLVRIKMRNLLTRAVFDKTFKAGEKFKEPDLVMVTGHVPLFRRRGYNFMDQETFETLTLGADMLGDDRQLLVDNVIVQIQKFNGNPIGLQFPPHVELDGHLHRTGDARRHRQRQRDQGRHARDRPGDPRAAVHQGRREGQGPHRDPGVRRTRLAPSTSFVDSPLAQAVQVIRKRAQLTAVLIRPRQPGRGGMKTTRREFLNSSIAGAATVAWARPAMSQGTPPASPARSARIRFAAIGLNHRHINSQVESVNRGGRPAASRSTPRNLISPPRSPSGIRSAKLARSENEILEDPAIQLVVSAAIPDERAPLGIEVMRHGKDFMVDKPGMTTLEQLAEDAASRRRRSGSIRSSSSGTRIGSTRQGGRTGQGRRDRPRDPDDRAWGRTGCRPRRGPPGSSSARGTAASSATSPRTIRPVPVLHRVRPQRRHRRVAGRQPASSAISWPRGLRRRDAARQRRHGLHPRGLVHAGRPRHLRRRPAHHPRHRRLHRDPQERRHRRPAGRQPPVPRRSEGDALRRLQRRGAALRERARGRRAEPDGDGRRRRPRRSWRWSWRSWQRSRRNACLPPTV